jgi:hypothetical protein
VHFTPIEHFPEVPVHEQNEQQKQTNYVTDIARILAYLVGLVAGIVQILAFFNINSIDDISPSPLIILPWRSLIIIVALLIVFTDRVGRNLVIHSYVYSEWPLLGKYMLLVLVGIGSLCNSFLTISGSYTIFAEGILNDIPALIIGSLVVVMIGVVDIFSTQWRAFDDSKRTSFIVIWILSVAFNFYAVYIRSRTFLIGLTQDGG